MRGAPSSASQVILLPAYIKIFREEEFSVLMLGGKENLLMCNFDPDFKHWMLAVSVNIVEKVVGAERFSDLRMKNNIVNKVSWTRLLQARELVVGDYDGHIGSDMGSSGRIHRNF